MKQCIKKVSSLVQEVLYFKTVIRLEPVIQKRIAGFFVICIDNISQW